MTLSRLSHFNIADQGFEYLNETLLFDGVSYTRLSDMPFQRSNLGLVAAHGGVYAIGGSKINPSYYNVSFLDLSAAAVLGGPPISSGWKSVAPLNEARCWPMVAAVTAKDGSEMVVAAGGVSLIPMFEPMGAYCFPAGSIPSHASLACLCLCLCLCLSLFFAVLTCNSASTFAPRNAGMRTHAL